MSGLLGLCLLAGLGPLPPLRVALTRNAAEVAFAGAVEALPPDGEAVPLTDPVVRPTADGLTAGALTLPAGTTFRPADQPVRCELRFEPGRATTAKSWRGAIRLCRTDSGRLVVVNLIDLEDYLLGVVPLEIGGPPAALEAQAVAARSYALARRGAGDRPLYDFDVAATQAYGGQGCERDDTSRAVAATAGRILVCDGRPLEAVYHQNCGGVRSSAEETWGYRHPVFIAAFDDSEPAPANLDEPALRAFLESPRGWCRDYAGHRWTRSWSWPELADTLRKRLPRAVRAAAVGRPTGLAVTGRGPSGRATELTVTGELGTLKVPGRSLRALLGDDGLLPSTLFVIDQVGGQVTIRGGGTGHGVGMCQGGALRMAAEGRPAVEILAAYYPGATLTEVAGPRR